MQRLHLHSRCRDEICGQLGHIRECPQESFRREPNWVQALQPGLLPDVRRFRDHSIVEPRLFEDDKPLAWDEVILNPYMSETLRERFPDSGEPRQSAQSR